MPRTAGQIRCRETIPSENVGNGPDFDAFIDSPLINWSYPPIVDHQRSKSTLRELLQQQFLTGLNAISRYRIHESHFRQAVRAFLKEYQSKRG